MMKPLKQSVTYVLDQADTSCTCCVEMNFKKFLASLELNFSEVVFPDKPMKLMLQSRTCAVGEAE